MTSPELIEDGRPVHADLLDILRTDKNRRGNKWADELLNILRTDKNRGGNRRILTLMKEQVEPRIAHMTNAQLREALADAVYALYHEEALHFVLEDDNKDRNARLEGSRLTERYLSDALKDAPIKARKESSENALDARHAENRERGNKIRSAWATGKYSTREICADQEWEGLGFNSRKAARTALQGEGVPDPDPWPTRNKHSRPKRPAGPK